MNAALDNQVAEPFHGIITNPIRRRRHIEADNRAKNSSRFRAVLTVSFIMAVCATAMRAAATNVVTLEGQKLLVNVDTKNCRWSAALKGTDVKLNNVYFLGGDNPSGWLVTSKVNRSDRNELGDFSTVTLHGVRRDQLTFDYHISVSKDGDDIVVRLDRANNTGVPVEVGDMDYMVADDARLGGTTDKWLSFGARSEYSEYYDLTLVRDLSIVTRGEYRDPTSMYEVCHLVRNMDTGNVILMGHLTVNKGQSRFEVGRKDAPDSMRMRGHCMYLVTMPPGKSFTGEKLLVYLGGDGIRALEHLGDLIGAANNIKLREKRPFNLDDRSFVSVTHTGWGSWMAGGTAAQAAKAIKEYGLDKFYYATGQGNPELGGHASWGLASGGGGGSRRGGASPYPAECYLNLNVRWTNGKVLDFSNPVCVEAEKQRIAAAFNGKEDKVNEAEVDYSEGWDKWPGQHDPFMSAVETWHAAAAPWRDFIDSKSPRSRNHSYMTKLDFNYGYIDLARVSEDTDAMNVPDPYVGGSDRRGFGHRAFLGECVPGVTMRFFYNGRVFWNDGDSVHVYRYAGPSRQGVRTMPYDEAKVIVNYKSIATSCMRLSEAFDIPYPEERIELMKRVSPPTADVAYPVDLFVRKPAQVWNLPVERPFGKWNVVGVFNFGPKSPDFTATLDAAQDLRLDPDKEYLVYEFWSKKLVGTFRGKFVSRPIHNKDCDMYSIVEKTNRPVLVSTSRHVRQMAFGIKNLRWDDEQNMLQGLSSAVSGDPYELRIWVPSGYRLGSVGLPPGLSSTTKMDGALLLVDYTPSTDSDVAWNVRFLR